MKLWRKLLECWDFPGDQRPAFCLVGGLLIILSRGISLLFLSSKGACVGVCLRAHIPSFLLCRRYKKWHSHTLFIVWWNGSVEGILARSLSRSLAFHYVFFYFCLLPASRVSVSDHYSHLWLIVASHTIILCKGWKWKVNWIFQIRGVACLQHRSCNHRLWFLFYLYMFFLPSHQDHK